MVEDVPAEQGPSGRLVVMLASAAVVVLIVAGFVLFRVGLSHPGDQATTSGQSSGPLSTATQESLSPPAGPRMMSRVSIGAGHVVTESQHLDFAAAASSLTLSVPADVPSASGGTFSPRIGNLQILTGREAPIAVTSAMSPGSTVEVPLPVGTTHVDIVYSAYHAVVGMSAAAPHDALALVTPLSISSTPGMRTTLRIDDPRVTHLGCLTSDGSERACGHETAKGWLLRSDAGSDAQMVVAQLTRRR